MPYQALIFKPGINTVKTPTLNEGGWSSSGLVRFREGLPELQGGWVKLNLTFFFIISGGITQDIPTGISGIVRGAHSWVLLIGTPSLALGSQGGLYVVQANMAQDITPFASLANLVSTHTQTITATSGSSTYAVTDAAALAVNGNQIIINTAVTVGNVTLIGLYTISGVSGSTFNIATSYTATSSGSVSNTNLFEYYVDNGLSPDSQSVTSSAGTTTYTITDPVAYAQVGGFIIFLTPTGIGGNTLFGVYKIQTASGSTFTITAGINPTTATISGTGLFAYYQYFGTTDQINGTGFGAPVTFALTWSIDNWGQTLIACPRGNPIYQASPPFMRAQLLGGDAPSAVNDALVAVPQRIMIAFGASDVGTETLDPMLVRWSTVEDYTTWTATATNSAGSYRLSKGSQIISGITSNQQVLIWTDTALYAMIYEQLPYVYGFFLLGTGCGLISPNACASVGTNAWWMSYDNFWVYNGNVTPIDCDVWDSVFQNLNYAQRSKVYCSTNVQFNEVTWFFPSASSTEIDSSVTFNYAGNVWYLNTAGVMPRTAWEDIGVFDTPIAVDPSGNVYQQESGYTAAGSAMQFYIESGYFDLAGGEKFIFMDEIVPDFMLAAGSVSVTVYSQKFPTDTPWTKGPYTITPSTRFIKPRMRARQFAIRIDNSAASVGNFWRLGKMRARVAEDGTQ